MTDRKQIAARFDAGLVDEVKRTAAEDGRSTFTDQAAWLLRIGLAGRQRLKELEQLAAETIAASNAPRPASTAGEDHLREHRRLCGLSPNQNLEDQSERS